MGVAIRRVDGPANSDDIYQLQSACLPHDTPAEVSVGHWWLAYDDDEPVAFACLAPSKQYYNVGYLARAGVAGSHRGFGLQKKLIRVRLALAKRLGWSHAITDTTDNPASANSLIACGFRLYKPAQPWAFKHSIYWRKQIAADASLEPLPRNTSQ